MASQDDSLKGQWESLLKQLWQSAAYWENHQHIARCLSMFDVDAHAVLANRLSHVEGYTPEEVVEAVKGVIDLALADWKSAKHEPTDGSGHSHRQACAIMLRRHEHLKDGEIEHLQQEGLDLDSLLGKVNVEPAKMP